MKEKVLVTGGCGFIGSHIVDKLAIEGHQIIVADNLTTGSKSNLPYDKVTLYEYSILDPEFRNMVMDEKPDYIIHQAAQVSVSQSILDIRHDEEVNIRGTLNVIEAALEAKTKKLVFASSAAVYGNPEYLPIDTAHPVKPLSPYGLSKLTAEKYLELYRQLNNMDYTILRYSNVYGPRQDAEGEGGVISVFMEKINRSEPLTIFGHGDQTRDFIYVKDVADANIKALTQGSGATLNVSTGEAVSLNELYKLIEGIQQSTYEVVYAPERDGDIKYSALSNELTRSCLKWKPAYTLKEGLKETTRYYSSTVQ